MNYAMRIGETLYDAQVESVGGRLYRVSFLDRDHEVDFFEVAENLYSMICDDRCYEVDIMEEEKTYNLFVKGTNYSVQILQPGEKPPLSIEEERVRHAGVETVVSPMTCTVVKILVKPGEIIENDQELLITEAMKLEMPIPSPMKGRVREVLVKEGQTIDRGAKLITLIPLE